MVRSPVSDTSTVVPVRASAPTETGAVRVNVAVGNRSDSTPMDLIRLSRRPSSLWSCVRSASNVAVDTRTPAPPASMARLPVTALVRPTASVRAVTPPSCSRTRYPTRLPSPTDQVPVIPAGVGSIGADVPPASTEGSTVAEAPGVMVGANDSAGTESPARNCWKTRKPPIARMATPTAITRGSRGRVIGTSENNERSCRPHHRPT